MSFQNFQEEVIGARTASEAKRLELKKARQRAGTVTRKKEGLTREIAAADRDHDERLAKLKADEIELSEAVISGKEAYSGALLEEWARLQEYLEFTNPLENIASLEDDCPILLLPLRLETRFKKVQRDDDLVDQLWVRVFPDDIAINSFESDLSDTEIRNARSYWLARWVAGKEVDGNRGAWRSLAAAHGPGRAYWLISNDNYTPLNSSEEPEKLPGDIILAIGVEDELVDPELSNLVTYWKAAWKAGTDKTLLDQAWSDLLGQAGEDRAAELVKDYKPVNIGDPPPAGVSRADSTVRVEFVIFKKSDELEEKLHGWSQPPTASILPERFVFMAYQDGALNLGPKLGNLVAPNLILGPDPAAEEGEELRLASVEDAENDAAIDEGDLIFAENMRWMFDFDEAVAKGMGFKIDLTSEQAEVGFDRVFVVGLKLGANKEKGQELLEELFAQHQSSRKGLAIVRQGTPTNNSEDDGAGYSWRHDPDDSFDIYFDDSVTPTDSREWFGKSDGRWLAEMLGIDPAGLQAVENYYSLDISEARAMQRALWPATMGHFMSSMMNPIFEPEVIEQTRAFFTRYVSGRGSLPAIRIGNQPYGILPATNYRKMGWFKGGRHTRGLIGTPLLGSSGSNFLEFLYKVLLDIDRAWSGLQNMVAYVGKDGDPHQVLLDIVGLHPDSVEFYKRYANSFKQLHNIYSSQGLSHEEVFAYYPNSYNAAKTFLSSYGYTIDADHPEPDILKKSFFKNSYFLGGDRIDKVPNSEVDPIGIYSTNNKNYIGWLIEAAEHSHDRLRLQEGFLEDKSPSALLYLLLHHALDLSYIDTNLKLLLSNDLLEASLVQQAYIEPDFIHIEDNQESESRWRYLYQSNEQITGDPTMLVGQYIAQHVDTLNEAQSFRDALAGLKMLEKVPTASLERAMMEHIDTVSYRHDAWILGYLHMQLEAMRGLQDDEPDNPARPGIYLGAYGWLEDLRPENKVLTPVTLPDELNDLFNPDGDLVEDKTNAGYILAPSQNHAVTAAVLRNGHLSTEDPEDKEELKIKLSSQRVRLALQIIEGIQGGQSLAALLGYQFERGLHDRTDVEVDSFIFELRNAFPLVAKKFEETEPGPSDPEYDSIDQIEAKNVMDGVAFLEHIEKSNNKTYPFGLESAPINLTMPPASAKQAAAINQEVREIIETNDAVADLALAESVHQVTLGNYERAAATLDTYSKGNFPPTPEVIKTPRSGTALTHRVALQFIPGLSHTLGAANVTPRMVGEPAIHDWLTRIMPGLDQIECVVGYFDRVTGIDSESPVNLSQLGLGHIDLLYLLNIENDQAMSALDDLIVQHVVSDPVLQPHLGKAIKIEYTRKVDPAKFTLFEMSSLIASLRELLLNSKALSPADAKLSNEAAKADEQSLDLDPTRFDPILAELGDFKTNPLGIFITDLEALIATADVNDIVNDLDNLISWISAIFVQASAFGLAQSGSGFLWSWQQGLYKQIQKKLEEVVERWTRHGAEYILLRDEYNTGVADGLIDEELFAILSKADLKISSSSILPRPFTPAAYLTELENVKLPAYNAMLNNTILPIRDTHDLKPLIQEMLAMAALMPPFDSAGLDISDQLKQVTIFGDDLLLRAENLSKEIQGRIDKASAFLTSAGTAADAQAKVEGVKNAAKAIFGDDFVVVPEFTLDAAQGTEWQNTLTDSTLSQRYLLNDLDMDFPMDDWLYGLSRVREKLYHVENTVLQSEGFNRPPLALIPSQFPYREDDYWLGMKFPDKKPGTEEPFAIEEDKLLYTAIYSEAFDPLRKQCGLLLDEWTEVIPSRDETLGLTFHYDQPNSEPPQTLLLVTPSTFTGHWRWDDLVNTLHETLEMAKKRAVEPDHVDKTVYSRFLPPIVSLASPLPLTATLNLAFNNQVALAKVLINDD